MAPARMSRNIRTWRIVNRRSPHARRPIWSRPRGPPGRAAIMTRTCLTTTSPKTAKAPQKMGKTSGEAGTGERLDGVGKDAFSSSERFEGAVRAARQVEHQGPANDACQAARQVGQRGDGSPGGAHRFVDARK